MAIEERVPVFIRSDHLRDDFRTAEFLTADNADDADNGRTISDYPRHLHHPRLNTLAAALVAAAARAGKPAG
jgi:hypothetical protein